MRAPRVTWSPSLTASLSMRPARAACSTCSIFMASTTAMRSPLATVSPCATNTFATRAAQLERILCAPRGGRPARAVMCIPQEHAHNTGADRTRIEPGWGQRGELAADQAGIHLTATERRMRYERMQEGGVGLGPG